MPLHDRVARLLWDMVEAMKLDTLDGFGSIKPEEPSGGDKGSGHGGSASTGAAGSGAGGSSPWGGYILDQNGALVLG